MVDAVGALEERVQVGVDEILLQDVEPVGVLALSRRVVVVVEGIDPDHLVPAGEQRLREVRSDEAGSAGDDDPHAWPGSSRHRLRQLLGERDELTVSVLDETEVGEEARHHDTRAEVAEPRFRPFAAGERERELRIPASRCEGKRECSAEAGIHVGHGQRPVRLAEALDVCRADDADRLGDPGPVLDQLAVRERATFDRLAALGLDHRARDRVEAAPVDVAEDVDRELLPEAALLHHRVDRRVA